MESNVMAQIYDSWLQVEDKGSILFVNLTVDKVERWELIAEVDNVSDHKEEFPNNFLIGETSKSSSMVGK